MSLIEYFKNGQSWGDGGIQDVLDKILDCRREDVLKEFIEVISKIELKKYYESQKKYHLFK